MLKYYYIYYPLHSLCLIMLCFCSLKASNKFILVLYILSIIYFSCNLLKIFYSSKKTAVNINAMIVFKLRKHSIQ